MFGPSSTYRGTTRVGSLGGIGQARPDMGFGLDDLWGQSAQLNSGRGGGGGGGGGTAIGAPESASEQAAREERAYEANLGFKNSQADRDAKQSRMNQVMGYLNGFQNQLGGMAKAGGQSGAGPRIDSGPVYNPQQIEQQVNAARAKNDATTQNQIRGTQQHMAGSGFGANSPMAYALQGGYQAANMANNADAERGIRTTASEQNAGQVLKGQQAAEQQYASRMDEDIRRRAPYFSQQNAIIAALAGLV